MPDCLYTSNTPNQPILSTLPVATINSIQISSGASVTVNGAGTLQIAGTITNNGTFDASNGTIELNGTSQSVSGTQFKNKMIKDCNSNKWWNRPFSF